MTRYLIVLLAPLLISLTGCNQPNEQSANAEVEQATESAPAEEASVQKAAEEMAENTMTDMQSIPGLTLCTDPRPEVCPQNYAPVCGVHEDGSRRTHSNSCMACSNAEVVGSLPGPCP